MQPATIISSKWRLRFSVIAETQVCNHIPTSYFIYRPTSYLSRTLPGNNIIDCSDVVKASPVYHYASRRCSNYISILDLPLGFNGLGKDSCETWRETFKFWNLVRLILEVCRYLAWVGGLYMCGFAIWRIDKRKNYMTHALILLISLLVGNRFSGLWYRHAIPHTDKYTLRQK